MILEPEGFGFIVLFGILSVSPANLLVRPVEGWGGAFSFPKNP